MKWRVSRDLGQVTRHNRMFTTTVFTVSLFGLAALFGFKAFELSRNAKTPLTTLRRIVDPSLIRGLSYCRNSFRKVLSTGLHLLLHWVGALVRRIEVAFYTTIHTIAARLNRFLRAKRLHIRNGGDVSAHLKTVLEKTEKDKEQPHSL